MGGKGKKKKPRPKIKQVWRRKDSSAASTSSPPPPPWADLPRDITANILHRLGAIEMLETAQKVCTTWRNVCKDPAMWREIDMYNLGDLGSMPYNLETMCRHAVDRSQGQLVAINIEYFGTDELLEYIAERSGQLRRLKIACCYGMCYEGLIEAVKRFPLLEELHLIFTELSSIEIVGRSCPLLKSFTLNRTGRRHPRECNEEAFAIAKTMPGLRHLSLFGNEMTNEGLQAILDGCPHLESLDVRQCFNVYLSGELGKRCAQQIKVLKRPYDSTEGYGWDSTIYDDDSFDGYPSGFSDLDFFSDDDEFYLDYDDYTRWDPEDSDLEELFGFY